MNTVSVPSCWGCNLENNFLFQFRPITQGDRQRHGEKETAGSSLDIHPS